MIIRSLLDTDFYKLTMQQLVFHHFQDANVEYQFHCRSKDVDFTTCFAEIEAEIKHLCTLKFSKDEIAYLRGLGFFKEDYLDFLSQFQLNAQAVEISRESGLSIRIKGPWAKTILFETPILAIVNECYFQSQGVSLSLAKEKLQAKLNMLSAEDFKWFRFADFGTRRRFSKAWQLEVLNTITKQMPAVLRGTSNVYFAKTLGLTPIGTMAHEYIQAMQVLAPDLRSSQCFAFTKWLDEYQGKLAIALSDTYTADVFLKDFNEDFCKAYDGVRQDSGNPFEFAKRFIAHLEKFGIDPSSKAIVFSDSLTFLRMIELYKTLHERIKVGFGIGTDLLNDTGISPIKIVMKMTSCNGQPVAKLSDDPQKQTVFDADNLQKLKAVFEA